METATAQNPQEMQEIPDIITITPNDPASLDCYLDRCDEVMNDTARIRNLLIRKVRDAVENIKFDFNEDKPMVTEKKLQAVDALDKLLVAREKSMVTRVTNRLRKKEASDNEALGKLATDLLRKIDMSQGMQLRNTPVSQDSLNDLEQRTAELEGTILESELRTDPYNLE